MHKERAEAFFLCERRRRRRIPSAMREQLQKTSCERRESRAAARSRLARRCPGRASEQTRLSSASERGRQRLTSAEPQRAERAIGTEERAEAFFPLRATTTAADSTRDARAAPKEPTPSIVDCALAEILPQLRRQCEDQRLLREPLLAGNGKAPVDQVVQYSLNEIVRHGGSTGDAD